MCIKSNIDSSNTDSIHCETQLSVNQYFTQSMYCSVDFNSKFVKFFPDDSLIKNDWNIAKYFIIKIIDD